MKILHLTSVVDGRFNSGTARVAREIISYMNNQTDIEMHFLHFDSSTDPIYSLPGIQEHLVPPAFGKFGGRFFSFLFFSLKQRIRVTLKMESRFDVAHWHVSRIYPFFFLLPAKKHILTLHDAGSYLLPNVNTLSTRVFMKVTEKWQKYLSQIIVDSEASKRDLVATGKYTPEKISVLYLASRFHELSMHAPTQFPTTVLDSNYLLCVSRWQEHKQVERAVECLRSLRDDFGFNINLILVGKPVGTYRKPLELVQGYGLREFVHMAADLSDEEIKYLYSHAQVNLYPSRHEGFGLSVLEGMICGCPAVVNFGHSTAEVLEKGGLAVDTSNSKTMALAVISILKERDEFSRAAYARSMDFDWGITTEKLIREIYINQV
jgi:glycosyltransferase involved in cell wall biosynthesis